MVSNYIKYGWWMVLGLFFSGVALQVLRLKAVEAWHDPSVEARQGVAVLAVLLVAVLLWLRHVVRTAERRSVPVRLIALMLKPIRWSDR